MKLRSDVKVKKILVIEAQEKLAEATIWAPRHSENDTQHNDIQHNNK
jgi:hypothetical protein